MDIELALQVLTERMVAAAVVVAQVEARQVLGSMMVVVMVVEAVVRVAWAELGDNQVHQGTHPLPCIYTT